MKRGEGSWVPLPRVGQMKSLVSHVSVRFQGFTMPQTVLGEGGCVLVGQCFTLFRYWSRYSVDVFVGDWFWIDLGTFSVWSIDLKWS